MMHWPSQSHNSLMCSYTVNSAEGKLLQRAKVIIWDESPMTHRHAYEAVDRMLRDLMDAAYPGQGLQEQPFGGKIIVLAATSGRPCP